MFIKEFCSQTKPKRSPKNVPLRNFYVNNLPPSPALSEWLFTPLQFATNYRIYTKLKHLHTFYLQQNTQYCTGKSANFSGLGNSDLLYQSVWEIMILKILHSLKNKDNNGHISLSHKALRLPKLICWVVCPNSDTLP